MSASGDEATLRLFVACEVPPDTASAIERWQRTALAGRDDVRPSHALHLTLAFLGSTPADRVTDLVAALAGVEVKAVHLEVTGVLFLPTRGAKRVVALVLNDAGGGLVRLQADVAAALAGTDLFEATARPWLPHVTVARFRRPRQPFPLQNVNIPGFCVVRTVLYSSLLERAGAVHTPLSIFSAS